jgi:hypothetical protein
MARISIAGVDRLAVTTARHRHGIDPHVPRSDQMIRVECPWCDGPATVDSADEAFECADCAIRVELALPPATEPIAKAA